MNVTLSRRWFLLCVVIFAILPMEYVATTLGVGEYSSANKRRAIFDLTRDVCMGRFIVAVPASSLISFGPARIPVEIKRFKDEGKNIEEFVRKAIVKSEEDKWLARDGLVAKHSMLGKVVEGAGTNHKIVFGVGRGSGSFYNVQSFVSAGNDLFVQEYEEFGEDGRYLEAVQEAKEVAALLRPRADEEIPTEPGFCIDGALVADSKRYMVEAVTFGIRLKDFDDVHVSIRMTKKDIFIASDAIEPRLKSAEKSALARGQGPWYQRIKLLRRGQRTIGKWSGFEVAARMPANGDEEESHEFAFLSHGEPKNPMLPVLDVKLHTGVRGNAIGGTRPSITDEEALYLWDKILGSIRPRQVQGAQ